jgi:hypothetical protein
MQKFLQTLTLVALIAAPWVAQGQSAKVSEYDGTVDTAIYSTIVGTSGATAWEAADQTAGYVDIAMPFGMQFGETAIAASSTLRVYGNGSAEFTSLTGSLLAPLYYATGYTTTATSVYYKSSSQMLTVEWRKVTANNENSYSFQLKLYSGGDIEFCYGPMTLGGTISVFTGLRSSDQDVFRARGEGGTYYWNTLERATNYDTRTLSSNYAPYYNAATHEGIVYTFTQPACVKPSSLTAEATAWNTIKVDWVVANAGTGYEVKYSTDYNFNPNTEGTSKNVNNGSALSYNITGLTGSTTYYIYVRKMCGGTPSGWSPMAYATTPQSCYSAYWPSVSSEGVVSWTSPNEMVTSYDVKYGLAGFDPETEGTAINNITALTTTLPVASMASATTYEVYLRTHCSASNVTTDWVGPVSFNTPCDAITVDAANPYLQQFLDYSMPICWSEDVVAGSNNWQFNYGQVAFTYTPDASSRLITPIFNLSPSGAYQVEFDHYEVDYSGVCDSLWLCYRTSPTSEWVRLAQYGNHSSSAEKAVVLLPNPTATYQLAFVSYGMDGNNIYLSNVKVRVQPNCPAPSDLVNASHTGNSVTLSWTANGPATAWQVAYGQFTTEEDYTIVNATTNPFTVSNLGLGEWYFYVRSDCGSEQSDDWAGPVSQNFGYCNPAPTSHDNNGITGVTFGNELVVNDNNTTTATTRYQNHSDMIGDLFAGVAAEVSITYYTGYTYGTMIWVDLNDDLEFTDNELLYTGLSTNAKPTTLVATITIPVGTPLGDHRMRIGGTDNDAGPGTPCYTGTYGVFRDYTVRVVAAPSCFTPSGLAVSNVTNTSADLTWDEVGLSTQWEVKYGPTGFDPFEEGTSMMVNTTTTLALDYLEMGTTYDVYVRAICDPEGPTDWSNGITFSTPNIPCLQYGDPGPEETATIGNGTTDLTYVPVYSYYDYSYSQQIYTAEEIGGSGVINSIAFEISGVKSRLVDIYLVETDKSSFESTTDWVAVTDADKVFTGNIGNALGWETYTLTTPFTYSGSGNLVVVVNNINGSYASGFKAKGASGYTNMVLYKNRDNTILDPANLPSGTRYSSRPNLQLGIQYAQCVLTPCYPPAVEIALSETEYAATLTFTSNNPDVENPTYGMIWGPQGFNPATAGTTVSSIANGTYTLSGLSAETTYDVYVYAVCGSNNGDTVRYNFTTPFIPNCKAPVIDGEYGASNITYNTATLTWRQPGETPLFWTVRYADADFNPATAAPTDYNEMTVTSASANLTGLAAGTTYYIYIKATCATEPQLDESPWSVMSNANPAYTFSTPECVDPSDVIASNVTNSTAMIHWTENGVATAWTVKYGPTGFDPETEGTAVAATADSIELTGLEPYTTYNAYVKANCTTTDESGWSEGATFRTVCPDGGDLATGDQTNTNNYVPLYTLYNYSFTEQIYTIEELVAASSISSISYYVATPNTDDRDPVDIYMGNTSKTEFESTTDWVSSNDMTLVYSGPMVTNEMGWHTIILNTPFYYDGTNLVVAFDNNDGVYQGSAKFGVKDADGNQAIRFYNDNTNFDPTNPTQYTGALLNVKNNFIFGAACNTDVTCFAPATVSTEITPANVVTVNWAARTDLRPVVNNYELKYGLEGFDPETQGVLIPALINVNTYTINADLAANTNYDVYVRTVCGADDHSNWTKASFTTYPTCWTPVDLTVTGTTQSSATLSWSNDDQAPTAATRWEVCFGPEGFGDPEYRGTKVETTNNTNFEVTGLNHTTKYEFYVRAICNATDKSGWSLVATGTTQCGVWQYADMPLTENFDGYTGNTSGTLANHVMPNCWTYLNEGTNTSFMGLPSIYSTSSYSHSTPNTLRFYSYNATTDANQYAVLPQFGFSLDTLEISFYGRFYNAQSAIQVGVMSDPTDASTFELVQTVNAPTSGYNTQKLYEVSFSEYTGDGRYVAFMLPKSTSGNSYRGLYMDDLTVKLREKVNTLPNAGGTLVACSEFIMPDTVNGSYANGLNATYVVRSAQPGYVTRISGDYDLESGYDFLKVYRGTANAANLVGTYTGTGSLDYMTTSELWQDSGFVTLVFTTDADNAFANTGFKFLVSCEQPNANMTPIEDVVEANGTYTWTAGNGETYTQHSTMDAAPDLTKDELFWLTNVAGFDSVAHHLALTLHPTYEISYNHVMCERDEYEFYGQTYTATGNYTVTLHSQYGADSVGNLALQVNPAPMAAIYYNNRSVTEIADYCDLADLNLQGRSNVTGATFLWDDQSTEASRIVNPHESNTYTVVATNPTTGCTSLPVSVTVTTTPVPALTVSGTNVICYGQSTTLSVADANNLEATYVWKKGNATIGTGTTVTVNPTETTTYTVTATTTNTSACAVTAEYTVTVNPLPVIATPTTSVSELCLNESVTLNAELVEGYTYRWSTGDNTAEATYVPTATGNYTVTVTDLKGCENTFTTASVTVRPSYELNEERSACIGMLPYFWGNQMLTEAGNYDQTFTIAYGCDSLVHLNFVVEDTAVYNSNRELCEGTTFTFGSGIYEKSYTATENTVITYVDTTSGDCPARYNLYLTVNTHNPANIENTVCDTYTWPLNNETYTTSGAYQTMLQTVKGCDSLVTLNLTVNYQNTGVQTVTACDTYTWNLNGETYTASTNEPTFTLQNQWTCDSVVTLDLTVNYRSYHEDFHCVRDARTYTWLDGATYSLSVETTDSLELVTGTNGAGCNEIALLHLVLNPVTDTLNWVTLEACDEYEVANAVVFDDADDCNGHVEPLYLHESGDYEIRTRAEDGHDQYFRVHLTVTPSTYHTTVAEACLPYTWIIMDANDQPFEVATITEEMVNGANPYSFSVDLSEAGYVASSCASIEVLRLTPKYPTIEVTDSVVICQNGSWTAPNEIVYSGAQYATGTYTWDDSQLNAAGCPMTNQVALTVNPVYNVTAEDTLCENMFVNGAYAYVNPNNDTQFVELTIPGALNETPYSNTVVANWTTASGCDSIVTLTYTVNPSTAETINEVACYQYTWTATGTSYTTPGTYTEVDSTVNANGCLHVATLNLTVNDTARSYDTINVCTSFEYNGETYRTTMTFAEKADQPAATGCDSIHYVTYKVIQNSLNEQYVYTNRPYQWHNGVTYNTNTDGVFYAVPVTGDCDSVLMLHFTIGQPIVLCENELPYTVTVGNTSFVLGTDAVSGEWTNNDAQGNDTIIAYTIKRNVLDTVPLTVCDTYTWSDTLGTTETYNVSGIHSRTYTAANGCDSIATLNLTVNVSTTSSETVAACDSYLWNGTNYTASGTYTYSTTNAAQCDSTVTLNLTINTNPGVVDTVNACVTYNWKGTDYTTSGNYSVSFTDGNGCLGDSVLHLTINQPVSVIDTIVVNADTASYRFNGTLYTAPYDFRNDGDIVVNTVSVLTGCDSTYTLRLVIPGTVIDTILVNGCGTYTWDQNSITYGWIPMTERMSHGMALFKDLTNNKYVYSYPVDTLFNANGEMVKISMLVLNMMQAEYHTDTLYLPLSLGTYSIEGIDADHNKTYNFANETVVDTQFYKRDTVMQASTAYCANYVEYTIYLVNNYTIAYDTVCDNVATYTWHGEKTLGTPGHTFAFEYVENEGTLQETVDSIYIYQLPVNNQAVDVVTACDSTQWNGTWYFASTNTATFQTTTARGCDSLVTLNLTVNYNTNTEVTKDECDSYTWTTADGGNGNVYTTSGDYTYNYNAANSGCPSVNTLHLTIRNNTNQGYTVAQCNSYTWTDGSGLNYTTSGNYTHNYNALNGCPSVDTLHLTINLPTHTGYTETACDSLTWNGTKYTTSGNYTYDYNTAAGCASTDTLHLTINASTHNSETSTQCDSYTWNDSTYTESGVYTYSYTNDALCPSTDTLHLTINVNNTGVKDTVTACNEYTWVINNNRVYTTSGDHSFTSADGNGCNATNMLHLTINSTTSYDSVLYISDGSYQYTAQNGNVTFYGPGVYNITESYTNAAQCDSTLNIELHVGTALLEIEVATNCSQYTWPRNGKTYTWLSAAERAANQNGDGQPAIYYNSTDNEYVYYMPTATVPQENNYDSVYMLSLTLTQSITSTDVVDFPISRNTLTYGDSIFDFSALNSKDFVNDTVTREVHFASAFYCDSIVDLTIHLVNNYQEAEVADICVTETSYTWRNKTIDVTTTDYDHAHTYYMYDTTGTAEAPVIEYVTVNQHPLVYSTERRTACDSYEWNGTVYTESTTNATYSTVDQYGCDSTVTLMLTINHNTSTNYPVEACETYTWAAANGGNGETYTESGIYTFDYYTVKGCPSTDTLTLTINNNTSTEYTVDTCDTYTWTAEEGGDGRVLTASGTYTYDYNTLAGCPSTNTLYLTIRSNSNQTITKTVCDTYTWTATEGGDDETYTVSGTYTFDYTATNGCPSTNTLSLTVYQNSGHTEELTACDSTTWHSVKYTTTGTYYYDYADLHNCPSVDTLNLTVNNATHNSTTAVECNSYTWTSGDNNEYTASGLYTYDYTNDAQCASTDTLHLTIGTGHAYGIQRDTVCGPYTWIVNGEQIAVLTESVETSTVVTNPATGCDSTIFLYLTVNPQNITEVAICDNETYTWSVNNTEYSVAGTYNVTENDDNGKCLSEEVLVLTVNPTQATGFNDQICLGNGYHNHGFDIDATLLPAAGQYTFVDSLSTINGCDSIVTLTLTVGDVINNPVVAQACDSYEWTAGDHQTYKYTVSGTYNSEAYANTEGCTTVDVLTLTIINNASTLYTETVCDGYMWNGTQYTQSGTYTYDYTDGNGCASTDTLNLTVNNSVINTNEKTACDSYTWEDGTGETYTTSGVYTFNYTTTDGCNGVDYLVLTIAHSYSASQDVVACDSYTYGNVEYTESAVIEDSNYTIAGCDSVVNINLTINKHAETVVTEKACSFFNWHGETYTESIETTWTGTADNGCDSIVTLKLTVNQPVATSFDTAVCGTMVWNFTEYTLSGNYTQTLATTAGCDSTVTMNLTVNQPVSVNETVTVCDSYVWNGTEYNQSGVYNYNSTTVAGCDSIATLNLTIKQSTASELTVSACSSYPWNGETYEQSGDYTFTTTNSVGCDSIATLHLTINQPASVAISATACNSYEWNGTVYTQSGVYTQNFETVHGCDSVVTLTLTVNYNQNIDTTVMACESYTWPFNNQTYTTSGTYTVSNTVEGCEGNATLHLTISNVVTVNLPAVTACQYYNWNGQTYYQTGDYSVQHTTVSGCDSTTNVHITINQPVTVADQPVTTCGSYTWNGTTYTTSGNYSYTAQRQDGLCDSTATLVLTINSPVTSSIYTSACGSYEWNGTTYTTSGTYTYTTEAANGCDSTATLHLTINQPVTANISNTACDSYEWMGTTYTESGNYSHTFTASNGCDSIVTLALTINQSTSADVYASGINTYEWNGVVYSESGIYTYTTTNYAGCDSVATLHLTMTYDTVWHNVFFMVNDSTMGHINDMTSTAYYSGMLRVADGQQVVLQAVANDSHRFIGWSNGDMNNIVSITVTSDTTLVANFERVINYYTVVATANNDALGTVSGSGQYEEGSTVTLVARATSGNRFVSWSNGVTDSIYSFVITENVNITATFEAIPYITVTATANDATMGTVTGSGQYLEGSTITLVAFANPGYHFVSWSDGTADSVYTFVATTDVNIIATFAANVSIDDVETSDYIVTSTEGKIIVSGAENMDVLVYDVNGRCVARQDNAGAMVEFTVPSAGVYLVKAGNTAAKRVVVIR